MDFDVVTETFLELNDGVPEEAKYNLSDSQRFSNNERFISEKQLPKGDSLNQRSFVEGEDADRKIKVHSIDMRTNHNTYMPPVMLFNNQHISSSGQETNSIRNDKSMDRLADKSYDNVPEVQLLHSVQSLAGPDNLRFLTGGGGRLQVSGFQTATFMNNTRVSENPVDMSKATSGGTFISAEHKTSLVNTNNINTSSNNG